MKEYIVICLYIQKEVLTPIEAAKYWIKSEKDPDGFTIKPAANGTGEQNTSKP